MFNFDFQTLSTVIRSWSKTLFDFKLHLTLFHFWRQFEFITDFDEGFGLINLIKSAHPLLEFVVFYTLCAKEACTATGIGIWGAALPTNTVTNEAIHVLRVRNAFLQALFCRSHECVSHIGLRLPQLLLLVANLFGYDGVVRQGVSSDSGDCT